MLNEDVIINTDTYKLAEDLLETYYLEQLIEISNLTEVQVLAILLDTGHLELPDVMPL